MIFTKGLEDESFKRVILSMPLSMRLEVGSDLKLLQEAFELDTDLLEDRRKARWERVREADRGYTVSGRDRGFFGDCTVDEAARIMGITPTSLRNRISGGHEFTRTRHLAPDHEDVVTCSRVHSSLRSTRIWEPPNPVELARLFEFLDFPRGRFRRAPLKKIAA